MRSSTATSREAFLDGMSALMVSELRPILTSSAAARTRNLDGKGLDVHIDFNIDERRMLHRRVNLLIYLNKEWQHEWGGAIELHSDPWNPAADEVSASLPLFNRTLLFETNEYSWHGFKRITLPDDRKALSRHRSRSTCTPRSVRSRKSWRRTRRSTSRNRCRRTSSRG